jgi:hypothetical protein
MRKSRVGKFRFAHAECPVCNKLHTLRQAVRYSQN